MSARRRPNLVLCAPGDPPIEELRQRLAAHPEIGWIEPREAKRLDRSAAHSLSLGSAFDLRPAGGEAAVAADDESPRWLAWQPRHFIEFPVVQWNVLRHLEGAKLLFCLRDPVELAHRRYLASPEGMPGSFEEAISACEELMAELGWWSSRNRWNQLFARPEPLALLLQGGVYEPPLARAHRLAGADRVHCLVLEQLRAEPRAALAEVWRFLDLPAAEPSVEAEPASGDAAPSEPIPVAARARLEELYAEHNARLASLLGGLPEAWARG